MKLDEFRILYDKSLTTFEGGKIDIDNNALRVMKELSPKLELPIFIQEPFDKTIGIVYKEKNTIIWKSINYSKIIKIDLIDKYKTILQFLVGFDIIDDKAFRRRLSKMIDETIKFENELNDIMITLE